MHAAPLGEFTAFLQDGARRRQLIACDADADGMTAGVLLETTLRRLGHASVQRFLPDRSRNLWRPGMREQLRRLNPERLFVLDLGIRSEPVLAGLPTCYIDHHAPEGAPPEGLVISSYHWPQAVNTSALVWELCRPLVDLSDRDWIAAIGAIGDLQERQAGALLADVKRKYGLRPIREIVALVNAGRRISPELAALACTLLARHDDPRRLLQAAEADPLHEARQELQRALAEAKRVAPVFSGHVALIRIRSPYQLHPLLAQIWRSRLRGIIVIAANEHYLTGQVNFSVRGPSGTNVRAFLRQVALPPGDGEYGLGHDEASGGSLPIVRWNQFLTALGFPSTAFAGEESSQAA